MIPRVHCRQRFITQAATAWALSVALGLSPRSSQAQSRDTAAELRLIESTEANLDPLGLDEATGQGLEEAARAIKPKAAALPVAEGGEVLTAITGVEETAHDIAIRFEAGLAFVEHTLRFDNRTSHLAELAYRLRVPSDAVVWSLSVCKGSRCNTGAPESPDPTLPKEKSDPALPRAKLSVLDLAGQRALAVHVSALDKEPLTLRIAYVTETPVHGGRMRLTLPARGFDPRIKNSRVTLDEKGVLAEEGDAWQARQVDPTLPIEIVRSLPARSGMFTARSRSQCAGSPCSREFRAAAPMPVKARETWLAIDASPSMEGEARGRVLPVIAALLSQLPDDTRVRAFAFAASATDLGTWPAIEAPLSKLGDTDLPEGGSGTQLSSVLDGFHDVLSKHKPRVIVISDGALDPHSREQHALERAKRAGAELSLVALSNDAPNARVAAGFAEERVLHITELADRALHRGELEALSDELRILLSPRVSAGLYAGESLSRESAVRPRKIGHDGRDFLPHWLKRRAPAPVWLCGTQGGAAAIAAPEFTSVPSPPAPADTGMPKISVLDLLRTQLVPKARGCLRDDRKGRANYAVGLTFRFLLARREIIDASVDGDLPEPLEKCLLELLPRLKLPWFTGTMRVRYPIHTEREAEPPVIELAPEAAFEVERALKAPATKPRGRRPR